MLILVIRLCLNSDDDSNKVKTPGGTIKQVSDVVTNRKGKTGAMGAQSASNLKQGDEA